MRQLEHNKEVKREILWNNMYIQSEMQPIKYKQWIDKGIIFIKDLIAENGLILDCS
jgi:hypothetical protein